MTTDLDHGHDTSPLRGAEALNALVAQGKLFCYAQDVADVMERDPRTVYDAIKRGEIPHTRIGQRYQVPVAWLRRQVDGTEAEQVRCAGSAA